MANKIQKKHRGRKRKFRQLNEKNCPILKTHNLIHGYQLKKKKK